jgi:hypothetical protein
MCPYFAMFPETFVQKYLVWTKPGEIIFDPFSGRGTTVFESLLHGRIAFGCDVNAVAICISNAKANPPTRNEALARLKELQSLHHRSRANTKANAFFSMCFSDLTFSQLVFLRKKLNWRRNRADRFIAALALGSLHGESHRSPRYFSNRMPRTISTKPDYSIRWWQERHLSPPNRDVFAILREMIDYRFESEVPKRRGLVKDVDARRAINAFPDYEGRVSMVITSPPYLDTTNFEEDQWLRLWFLGGPERPVTRKNGDDRHHAEEKYWDFLTEAWAGVGPLMKRNAHIVVRIGGKRLTRKDFNENLVHSIEDGFERKISLIESRSSAIRGGQLRAFHPGKPGQSEEHDFHFVLRS